MTLTIRLNDKDQPLAAGQSVADLLAAQEVNPQGVAVALNGAVLPRGRWAETRLNDGDELHLFTAIAGG
ncbi:MULTISPECIES: sulfur carrier protein ThiS [Aeromonas]|uniref:Thiamine biosynthesis protein ThiS n=1 Tax=Aeromonas caviae TaxID=648 RepID=A0AA37FUF3_AERCA|nr:MULTISPECIES: sulfur carrier protein ThiS [Aeromonas]OKP44702.1 thiamine biosynthesis protein ThiS [Aeromonas allosaccharophila]TNH79643.1 thiamine biosynthesis protein ThiS [Aeromonas sobria]GJA18602.1 thiamine biosynthesis protein ThiS [Aeromonas caviae]GJA27051.1 thiamine biosynthesis protein ThiS [Aeromonas caviae]GJA62662.1 thiamine biosynthesis protein ThiS [Aeromonas caviae]